MKWETVANPTREAFKTLKIRDTFPNNGLILIEDSLEVKIGGEVKTLGTDYRLTAIDGNHNNGFIVEFKESVLPINAKILMTYKTSYDPEKGIKANTGSGLYKNQVVFEGKTVNDNSVNVIKNAKKQVNPETVNTGKKVGKLKSIDSDGDVVNGWVSGNTRKIEWEIYTNYLKQNLGNEVSITDKLGYEGEIDEDSIKVRKYTVDSGGDTGYSRSNFMQAGFDESKIQIMSSSSEPAYTVVMNEDGDGFTLNFEETVNERYVIIFRTSVPDTSQKTYTNTANLKVGDKEYPYTGSVNFDKADKKLSKKSLNTAGKDVYTDDEINWNIKINESLSIIDKDIKIVDTISSGMVYKEESLKVYKLQGTESVLVEDEYTLNTSTNNEGETILEIVFADSISSTYEIEYTTVVTATEGQVNNSVEYSGKNENIDSIETTKLNAKQFSYVGGDPSKGKIIINKVDNKDEKITAQAEFEVYYILNGEEQLVGGQTYKTEDGKVEIGNLRLNRSYYIREISAPEGFEFDLNDDSIEVEVTKASGKDDSGAYKYRIKNDNKKTEVKAVKVWNDGPEEKPDIKLQLYRNKKAFGDPVVLEDGKTEYTWEDLNLTDNTGKKYEYTIDEIDLPADYKKTVSVSGSTTTIFNTYQVKRTDITGRKEWIGGPEVKPDIRLQLYQNGDPYGDPVTLLSGNTSYTWNDLPLSDNFGNPFTYTMDELNEPDNYPRSEESSIAMYGASRSHDGLTVTNTYKSPVTDITGRKVWEGGPEVKPTIELQLYRDDEALGEPVELANGSFEYVWEDLEKTDNDGKVYEYTVKEVETPENYIKEEDGLTVRNIYVSPKTEIRGRKIWIDGPEAKPTIELQLYRGDEALGNPVELRDGETEYTWTDLDLTDKDGKEYEYTIKEIDTPENYEKVEEGLTVTNTYVSPKTQVIGRKIWIGGPSPRPDIQLQLYRNSEALGDPVKLVDGETEYTWVDLDLNDKFGKPYKYTVDEVSSPNNYEQNKNTLSMYGISRSEDGLTVTNTYKSPVTDITGRKVWEGGPEEKPTIELQLYRNNKALGNPVELVDGTFEYVWKDLDITDSAGEEYEYTVKEVETPENYIKEEEGLTVRNTYVSPKTEIRGRKIWIGGSSKKPTIQLQLYRNGEPLGSPVKLRDGETGYTWTNLNKYNRNGVEYKYTVDEIGTPYRYRKSISDDGLTITNRYRPPVYPPTDPEEPRDPDKPDPEEPRDSDKPDPEEPRDPDKPDPEEPRDPNKPDPEESRDPDKPDPEDPRDPVDPTEPGEDDEIDSSTPGDVPTPEDPEDETEVVVPETPGDTIPPIPEYPEDTIRPVPEKDKLVKTGSINDMIFYIGGLILILAGLFVRRRVVK